MTPAGYQILWRRFYTDKQHKDGGWMSGWEDFLNHKLYSSEKNAQEAIGYIKRDTWFNSAEFIIVPLYYSESFKSALREEIEKKKQRSIMQTTRSDFDLGYEAALNEFVRKFFSPTL